jgi:hypothetical protein
MKKYETHLIPTFCKQLDSLIKGDKSRTQLFQKDVYYYSSTNTPFETERFISALKMLLQRIESPQNKFDAHKAEIKSEFRSIEFEINLPASPSTIFIHEIKHTSHPLEYSKFYISIGRITNSQHPTDIFDSDIWAHYYFDCVDENQSQNKNTEMPALEVPEWNSDIAISELYSLFSNTTLIANTNTVAL